MNEPPLPPPHLWPRIERAARRRVWRRRFGTAMPMAASILLGSAIWTGTLMGLDEWWPRDAAVDAAAAELQSVRDILPGLYQAEPARDWSWSPEVAFVAALRSGNGDQ